MFALKTPIKYLKWVGESRLSDLKNQKISTIEDLLFYFPYRYEDRRRATPFNMLKPDSTCMVAGRVISANLRRSKRGMSLYEILVSGEGGQITAVWFNQPYMARQINRNDYIWLYGKVSYAPKSVILQMNSPDFEVISDRDAESVHTGRIVPVYHRINKTSSKMIRRIIYNALLEKRVEINEIIPSSILRKRELISRSEAFIRIHFPTDSDNLEQLNEGSSLMHRRFAYEELLMLQASLHLIRKKHRKERGIVFNVSNEMKSELLTLPPFKLTAAQNRVLEEIFTDMSSPYPMNRLLQGDVGSGKTVVALLAALAAIKCGYQASIMAPTEILAEQHYKTAEKILANTGINILLLTSFRLREEGRRLHQEIESGNVNLVIGTHALIQEKVKFNKLGLVIIDEQHRFGVEQREKLTKKGTEPDRLIMTATPIPRSLALTAFGGLELSIIDQMPAGRKPIETVLTTEKKRKQIYEFIRKIVEKKRQNYIVYPIIEKTEKMDLKAAKEMAEHLQNKIFPNYKIGLLHGKMKGDEKESIMNRFVNGEIDILVSTTVVEVGIDVPNVSVILIEHAERFGLSQLHQLRGRIGRGKHKSTCILMINPPGSTGRESLKLTEQAKERLKIMRESNDGFVIAQKDLEIRGPGEFLGTKQSGIPKLKVADLVKNYDLLLQANSDTAWFFSLEKIERSPDYNAFIHTLREWWKENISRQN